MGFTDVKINGQWVSLMNTLVKCLLCDQQVYIAHLAKVGPTSWICGDCDKL